MCELCNEETRDKERSKLYARADKLKTLAGFYERLADGAIKPHSDKAKSIGFLATNIIKFLVEEWT